MVEPQLPTTKFGVRRSILEAATPLIASSTQRLVKALGGEYLAMNRARKRTGHLHGLLRLMCAKAGSPTSGDAQGDGVAIVAKCPVVMPGTRQRAAESTVRTWDSTRNAERWLKKLREIGEPDAVKAARPVRGGVVEKGLSPDTTWGTECTGQSENERYLVGHLLY